jgi:hypothetical protein
LWSPVAAAAVEEEEVKEVVVLVGLKLELDYL